MIKTCATSASVVWAVGIGLSLSACLRAVAGEGDVAASPGKAVQSNVSTASSGRRPLAVRIAMAEKLKAGTTARGLKTSATSSSPAARPTVPRLLVDCEESMIDARQGDSIRWRITIRNAGAAAGHMVTTLYFAEGIEPISAEGLTHSLATGEVRFSPVESLGPDEQIQLEVTGRATKPGAVSYRVEVGCRDLPGHVAREAVILVRPHSAE
jgi:hypothetical protein